MLYLIHKSDDLQNLEESILPLLEGRQYTIGSISEISEFEFKKTDCVLTYLDDESLRVVLPTIANKECKVGILSHPKMKYAALGLGISLKNKEVIDAINDTKEVYLVDLFCCNEKIVFQSVNIGEIFALVDDGKRKGFYRQFYRFFKQIRRLPFLRHNPFTINMDGEKIIDTSAIGIIAAEYSNSYIVAKRLITQDITNDGLFHMLIFAPQNILQLIGFIFKSLSPSPKKIKKNPLLLDISKHLQ
jgi:diacylglycerol kinase family enzyme